MASIAEIRAKYPQYQDMSDEQLADAMHRKFYSDMPREEFNAKIGLRAAQPQSQQMTDNLAELSAITQNPARAQYDALPAWQKPLVAASDIVSLAADGATFGFGDKAVAKGRSLFTGKSYEDELAEQRRLTAGAANRAGSAGTAAQITGAVAAPLAAAGKGATLAGRAGTAAMTGGKGLAARTGLMGVEGAGYGALTAAGHDQDLGTGALVGAAGGVGGNLVGEGISAGVGKIAGMFNPKAARTTVDELTAAKNAAYEASEQAGVIVKPEGIQSIANKVRADMAEFGYHPKLQPGAAAILDELDRIGTGPVTLKGLDTVRKMAGNAYIPGNKSNNAVVKKIIGRIDEMIDSSNPQFMAGVNTREGVKSLLEARKLAQRARKLETVEQLAHKGARIGGRQKNQDAAGATRRQLQTILDNEAKGRGFTTAEKKALEKATGFTLGQRALDAVGGLMPQGRLGAMLQGATAIGTGGASIPWQLAGMAAGAGAHKASEALARKSVEEFVDLVARGGVPAPVVQNALQRLTAAKRDAITRALMAISVNQASRAQAPAQ